MYEFSVFKKLLEKNAVGIRKDTQWVINRVTSGENRATIEAIRSEADPDKKRLLKESLTSFAFSGIFSRRADAAILSHSGLMVADFDHVKDIDGLRQQLMEDPITYLMFRSPSGDGIKLVVKVPPNIKEHRGRFKALMRYFNRDDFDPKNGNLSRLCFESWDPDLYYNPDSEVFSDIIHDEIHNLSVSQPLVRLHSDDAIIRKLLVWAERKYPMVEGQRNNNTFILASAMNRCGVSRMAAEDFLIGYQQDGFTKEEIMSAIRSAYSKTSDHGTEALEDDVAVDRIKEMSRSGSSFQDISDELSKRITDKREREQAIERVLDAVDGTIFWDKSKSGAVSIDHTKFKRFLQDQGFYKLYPSGSLNYIFVRVRENMVSNTSDKVIKDFVMRYIEAFGDKSVFNYMAGRSSVFKEDYLNMLDTIDLHFSEDDPTFCTLYYRNCAVRAHKDGKVECIDYVDLGGYIWEDHIINRDFERSHQEDGDFNTFIELVGGNVPDRIMAHRTAIGYFLHGHKSLSNNRAIIYNDGEINESPNGGSGKGIIFQAIGKVKRVNVIDGKSFSFDKGFPYQTVGADCQVLLFDDVQKRFNFERTFSLITEGMTLEKKNKDAIRIPVSKSPKIGITTNYTIEGKGGSHDRRRHEVEMSSYFNANRTPQQVFGRELFNGWDDGSVEWRSFDNYMVNCAVLYLKHGLTSCKWDNLDARKFIGSTSHEFWEWVQDGDKLPLGVRIYRSEKMEEFCREYPDYAPRGKYQLSGKRWAHWLDAYGRFKQWDVASERDTKGHYTRYIEPGTAIEAEPVEEDKAPF